MNKTLAFAMFFGAGFPLAASCATPLTSARVSVVSSTKGGTEAIGRGVTGTSRDHGGARLQIVTEEIGRGQHAQATLLGFALREIRTEPLCNVGGQAKPCAGRGTIVGYRRTWDASGREDGNFQFTIFPVGLGSALRANLTVH
ncbi:MAG TPA: DUF4879 domain-containing protein [Luteibacter sp.]|nr:DUF4879 domain-containing protein [Luteibacter sp.]